LNAVEKDLILLQLALSVEIAGWIAVAVIFKVKFSVKGELTMEASWLTSSEKRWHLMLQALSKLLFKYFQ
jgi:hypothetical protein